MKEILGGGLDVNTATSLLGIAMLAMGGSILISAAYGVLRRRMSAPVTAPGRCVDIVVDETSASLEPATDIADPAIDATLETISRRLDDLEAVLGKLEEEEFTNPGATRSLGNPGPMPRPGDGDRPIEDDRARILWP